MNRTVQTILPVFLMFLLNNLMPATTQAQVIHIESDTITWKTSSYNDMTTGTSGNHAGEFITFGNHMLRWVQRNTTEVVTLDYTVTSTTGSWLTGDVSFETERKGKTKTFRFRNEGGVVSVLLTYLQGEESLSYTFTISDIIHEP